MEELSYKEDCGSHSSIELTPRKIKGTGYIEIPLGCSGLADGFVLPSVSQMSKANKNLKSRVYVQQYANSSYHPMQLTLKQQDDPLITRISQVLNDTSYQS